MYNFEGYMILVSDKYPKKYVALVDKNKKIKRVYFGDVRYEQYYDKLGYYKNLNHYDENRKYKYYKRHGRDAKEGTAKWFSHNILW